MRTSEYTMPLEGTPCHRSTGLIQAYDRFNRLFNIGEITFERHDDQNYQYIITPYWPSIDSLPDGLFQGIPGINMDIRRDCYYRVNMTPSFISMRTPSESRENVNELMTSVGLDYYDPFEWLLRTETKCGDDNLVVVRKPDASHGRVRLSELHRQWIIPEDDIEIEGLDDFNGSNARLIDEMYQLLQSGCKIYIHGENRYIEDHERQIMLELLKNMMVCSDRCQRSRREEGIREVKREGRYQGRKPMAIDDQLLRKTVHEFRNHLISEREAMTRLGVSRSTFYRKIKSRA